MTPAGAPRQAFWWCSCRSTCTRKVICTKPAAVSDTRETVEMHQKGCCWCTGPTSGKSAKTATTTGSKPHKLGIDFFSVREKAQKMRFVKIWVFIGCWMKTFWSSLVLGIRERTGQPIPNVKGNLFESKSARTKTFRNTYQWNVRLWK